MQNRTDVKYCKTERDYFLVLYELELSVLYTPSLIIISLFPSRVPTCNSGKNYLKVN